MIKPKIFLLFRQARKITRKKILLLLPLLIVSAILEFASIVSIYPLVSSLQPSQEVSNSQIFSIIPNLNLLTSLPDYILFAGFIVLVILSNSMRLFTIAHASKLSAKFTSEISSKVYNNIIRQSYLYHSSNNSSDSINILTQSIGNLMIYINNYNQIIISTVAIISILVSLFVISISISLMCLAILSMAYLIIAGIIKSKLKSNGDQVKLLRSNQILTVQESLSSIKNIILSSSYSFYTSQFYLNEKRLRNLQATNTLLGLFPKYLIESVGITLLFSVALFLNNSSNTLLVIPYLATFALAIQKLLPAAQQVYFGWSNIKSYSSDILNILHYLELPASRKLDNKTIDPYIVSHSIQMKNISYGYPGTSYCLNNVNLTLYPGDCVGLIGQTGSGKSTLINILMGLISPSDGAIMLDNRLNLIVSPDLLPSYQKNISHVPQKVHLIDASIAENIAFAVHKDNIDLKRVDKLIEICQLKELIRDLPGGINYKVGEGGELLSGGQRQRIGIARALYNNSQIIIMDEATSALDPLVEKDLLNSLLLEFDRCIIIMITHKYETLLNCSRVYELKNKTLQPTNLASNFQK